MEPINIIVNGTEETVNHGPLTFEEVVDLAFGAPSDGDYSGHSVSYRQAQGNPHLSGILYPGQSLKPSEGMIFDVTPTNRS
jgi:hypothetical protein